MAGIVAYTCILSRRIDMSDKMITNVSDAVKQFITANANTLPSTHV